MTTWTQLREAGTAFTYTRTYTYGPIVTRSLADAFKGLKAEIGHGVTRLFRADEFFEGEIDEHVAEFLNKLDRDGNAGSSPVTIGEIVAAWYVARLAEIDREYCADDDMTRQAFQTKRAGAKRQVSYKY